VFLALFFGAQALVAQHDAEYGPEKHNHHGHPCDIQLVADHAKAPSLPTPPAITAPSVVVDRIGVVAVAAKYDSWIYPAAQSRAPPISVL
jgi:hypothetical protein